MKEYIVDCERDVKGIHQWNSLGNSKWRWCSKCGTIGKTKGDNLIFPNHSSNIQIMYRIASLVKKSHKS